MCDAARGGVGAVPVLAARELPPLVLQPGRVPDNGVEVGDYGDARVHAPSGGGGRRLLQRRLFPVLPGRALACAAGWFGGEGVADPLKPGALSD